MKCRYDFCKNQVTNKHKKPKKFFCSPQCKNKYFVDKRRWELKLKAIFYKGGKCEKCGYNKCPTALEFHHRNPKEKKFSISHPPTRSWELIKKEVKKCDLLCSNCHQEEEFKRQSAHKEFIPILIEQIFGSRGSN